MLVDFTDKITAERDKVIQWTCELALCARGINPKNHQFLVLTCHMKYDGNTYYFYYCGELIAYIDAIKSSDKWEFKGYIGKYICII